MAWRRREAEVLVVGAGPVGLFGALALAERGVVPKIIEEQWKPAARSYALAIHPATLEILEPYGIVEELLERGHRVDSVAFQTVADSGRRWSSGASAAGTRSSWSCRSGSSRRCSPALEQILWNRLKPICPQK